MSQAPSDVADRYTDDGVCRPCGLSVDPEMRAMHPRYCRGAGTSAPVPLEKEPTASAAAADIPAAAAPLPAPAVPAGWHQDPHGAPQLRYWDGAAWTEHTSPYGAAPSASPATPAWPSPDADSQLVRRVTEYTRWSGVAWMVLGALQVLSVLAIIAGLWNLYAGYTRIRFATVVERRDPSVPAAVTGLAEYVIIGLINLLLGGVIGVVLVGVDLFVRDQILKNRRLFEGSPAPQVAGATPPR